MNPDRPHSTQRVIVISLLAALSVLLAVGVNGLARPAEYTARVSLVAVPPTPKNRPVTGDYASTVGLTLPGIADVARSEALLSRVANAIPGSPPPSTLRQNLSVDVVPLSAVTRVSIATSDPVLSSALASEMAQALMAANTLGPNVVLRRITEGKPPATQTVPDTRLIVPAALGAAAAAGLLSYALLTLRTGRVRSRAHLRSLVGDTRVTVFEPNRLTDAVSLLALANHLGGVQVVNLHGAESESREAVVTAAEQASARPIDLPHLGETGQSSGTRTLKPLLLAVKRGVTPTRDISAALSFARAANTPVAGLLLLK